MRNINKHPPIEQLEGELGLNISQGFLLIINGSEDGPSNDYFPTEEIIQKLIKDHSWYVNDSIKILEDGANLSHFRVEYNTNRNLVVIEIIVFDTSRVLK